MTSGLRPRLGYRHPQEHPDEEAGTASRHGRPSPRLRCGLSRLCPRESGGLSCSRRFQGVYPLEKLVLVDWHLSFLLLLLITVHGTALPDRLSAHARPRLAFQPPPTYPRGLSHQTGMGSRLEAELDVRGRDELRPSMPQKLGWGETSTA